MVKVSQPKAFTDYIVTWFVSAGGTYTKFAKFLKLENVAFGLFQVEASPTTGTLHLQGFVQLYDPRTKVWLARRLPGGRFFARRGSVQECVNYCSKDESCVHRNGRYRCGNVIPRPGQGFREDLAGIAAMCREGESLVAIARSYGGSWIRFHRGIRSLHEQLAPDAVWPQKTKTIWLFGIPGGGKTSSAKRIFTASAEGVGGDWSTPVKYFRLNKPKFGGNIWFTGYKAEAGLLIDDFGHGWLDFDVLMTYLDPFPVAPTRVCVHNGMVQANWSRIIITTNMPPWLCYKNLTDRVSRIGGLSRRLTIFQVSDNKLTPIEWVN